MSTLAMIRYLEAVLKVCVCVFVMCGVITYVVCGHITNVWSAP